MGRNPLTNRRFELELYPPEAGRNNQIDSSTVHQIEKEKWRERRDSNPQQPDRQSGTLTN